MHSLSIGMAIIFMFLLTNRAHAQVAKELPKTTYGNLHSADSLKFTADSTKVDTVALSQDSLKTHTSKADTSKLSALEKKLGIRISKDALPDIVKAEATDSAVLDMKHNLFYLYGDAKVHYQDLQLDAGRIAYNQANSIVTASPLDDSEKTGKSRPSFAQGGEKFTYDSLQYNFKSKRAIVRNVRSKYGEGYMFSQQVKRNPDQSIYGSYSVYTTCALDTPHFGIVARKIKVVPGHVIATGPANIEIEGVPTPLFLPFGLFPISQKQRSGFVIPTYTIEQARGLGLVNGGYYFHLSDYTDFLAQANIFSKGSWAFSGISTYKNRYHYSGGLSFSYAYNKTGEDYEPGSSITKDFRIVWQHQTDAKAKPGQTFNAKLDAGTSTFYSNNSYDPNQILQNQYSSNISFSKNWIGTPYSLTVSARHSQNTANHNVLVTLPELNFNVGTFTPFRGKHSIKPHWYDKISVGYTLNMQNTTTFVDTAFNLNNLSLGDMRNGIKQNIPISATYTIFRFVNMAFSATYNEYWLTDKSHIAYNPADGQVDTTENRGFFTARDFNAGVNFNTRIYGLKMFPKGSKIRGIRHVLTPNIGMSYHPNFGAAPFNYWYKTHLDTTDQYTYLSVFPNPVYGPPANGKAGMINFGLGNTLQMKMRSSGRDTNAEYKNISLIDGLSISSSYNLAADSFQWGGIPISFHTNVLNKLNVSASAQYTPYDEDPNTGRAVNKLLWDESKGIARFTGANLSLGTNFRSKSGTKTSNSEEYNRILRDRYGDYMDFSVPWSFNLNYSLTVTKTFSQYSKRDTITYDHYATFQGEFSLTPRWKISVSSGYNFTQHQLSLTSIDIYRDLHCWAMHLQTYPFGPRKSFNFTLNVKASVLQDLKLTRRRDYRDAVY